MSVFPPSPVVPLIARLLSIGRGPVGSSIRSGISNFLPQAGQPLRLNSTGATPRTNMPSRDGGNNSAPASTDVFANIARAITGFQPQQQDPLASLYDQLLSQLQQPVNVPTGVDTSDLMAQVRAAIDPIYNQRASEATNRTNRARTDVQSMYNDLAGEYRKEAPAAAAQAQEAQQQIQDLYGQLRSNIEGNYSRVSEEQADLFKQLGIEQALPDVLGKQEGGVQSDLAAASQLQAANEQYYMDQGQTDESYFRQGAPLASLTGTNYSKDMLFDLNQTLDQLDAERASGIQGSYTQLLGQAQDRLSSQQNQAYQEQARRQGMLWDMLQAQMAAQSQQQNMKITPDVYMSSLPPQMQQSVGSAFTQLQRSPESIYGKVQDPRSPVPGTFVNTTPEWYLSQVDVMQQRGQIDSATAQALKMYLQLYYQMGG